MKWWNVGCLATGEGPSLLGALEAQWLEHLTSTTEVVGSIPSRNSGNLFSSTFTYCQATVIIHQVLDGFHLCPEMHIIRSMLDFDKINATKCLLSLSINHLVMTWGPVFLFGLSFGLGLGLLLCPEMHSIRWMLILCHKGSLHLTRKLHHHFCLKVEAPRVIIIIIIIIINLLDVVVHFTG